MSKAISTLALGSLIDIYENGVIKLYEIAGFNVHGTGMATLVRKEVYTPLVPFTSDMSGSNLYTGSNLDAVMQAFENNYAIQHRNVMQSVTIVCVTGTGTSVSIARKVFALSITELSGSGSENANLPLYSNNASRIKNVSGGGTATRWWTRSKSITNEAFDVIRSSGVLDDDNVGASLGLVPAFVIPSTTLVSDSVTPEGGYRPLFYADLTPNKPTLIAPRTEYVDLNSPIDFEWQHNIDTGTPQTRADLQYQYNGGAWTALTTVMGSGNAYTVPANTFSAGDFMWRAKTYNADGVAGDWSDPVPFVGVGSPAAPTISGVTASSRPAITWQSTGQVGYQLQVLSGSNLLYDSDETAGLAKSLTLPLYLANGSYKVKLRVINSSLLWSSWAEYNFTLAVTPPATPTIAVTTIADGAHISISNIDVNARHMYLMRNDIPVAEITGLTQYDDYAALGSAKYAVRIVNNVENYTDSAPVTVTVSVGSAALAVVDDPDNIVRLKQKTSGQPAVARQKQLIGTGCHYAGREYPVFTFGEFTDEAYSPAYYYTSAADWTALETLISRRKTVLYRDMLGNKYYGVITTDNHTQDDTGRVSFALTLQRVDYVEQIDYAEVA